MFHPVLAEWFLRRVGRPTDVQAEAWPRIAGGEHVLVAAPTGSGKTMTAFLWAVNQLVTGRWAAGRTSVLYVSPLKALNNDIRRNLLVPLRELDEAFAAGGVEMPRINVLTRSGDTPQSDRRRMRRHPPEILITTPESLNLLLSSAGEASPQAIYWLSAADPASLCGLGLDATLPKRLPGTHLVYRGAELVVISKRNAKDLTVRIARGDPDLPDCLAFLRHLLTRQFQPLSRITIETVNGRHAAESEYVDPMRGLFDVAIDFRHVIVYPRIV